MVIRRIAWLAAAAASVLAATAPEAVAAPEVHRLNLVLSSNPGELRGGALNQDIDEFNRERLAPEGLQPLGQIKFAWYHQAEMRYFVRPNVAVSAGVGMIRAEKMREFLPRISQSIVLRVEVESVPVHVGAAYYLAPYTQGDFQARAYVGGGFLSLTSSRWRFEHKESMTDSATTVGPRGSDGKKIPSSVWIESRRNGPGYYLELGGHMFFASRYSVLLGGIYRDARIRNMRYVVDVELLNGARGRFVSDVAEDPEAGVDLGGLGIRLAAAIGF